MKLGEVVVNIEYYNFTKFHYILMKKIIVLYQTHFMDGLLGASELGPWMAGSQHNIYIPKGHFSDDFNLSVFTKIF